jgi:hypothetical protein
LARPNNITIQVKITRPVVLGESKPIVRRKPDQAAA